VAPSPNPLGSFLASLAVVRGRPDARLLPAHGAVAESVHARIDQLVHHHGERLGAVEELVRRGAATAYEVAGRLGWPGTIGSWLRSTCSTRCWPWPRPQHTWSCWSPRVGCGVADEAGVLAYIRT